MAGVHYIGWEPEKERVGVEQGEGVGGRESVSKGEGEGEGEEKGDIFVRQEDWRVC